MKKNMIKKILVVGLGSIGTRHVSNLINIGCNLGIYSYQNRIISSEKGITYEPNLSNDVLKKYDAIVIANSTEKHLVVASMCVEENKPFYIEKPLSNNFEGIDSINRKIIKEKLHTKVGYMMRAHPNLLFIKDFIKKNQRKIYHVTSTVGQWLPDWRPNTDYRKCYSAFSEYGGGVIYELIHELDTSYWLFGEIDELFCFKDKVSDLEVNTEDFAQIIMKTKAGFTIDVKLDYLKSVYKRDIEIIMDGMLIFWNFVEGTVTLIDKLNPKGVIIHQTSENFTRNSMFVDLMGQFLDELDGNILKSKQISFSEGIYSMMLAVKAHESAKQKKWVKI